MRTAGAMAPRAAADTLEWYLAIVNAAPMLSAEEELALARRFREHGDQDAAKALIVSHLRLVVRIARSYLGYGLNLGDLIQEGTVGLMRAVKRYDPERGVRLAPFAVYFVRAHIQEFVLRNWRIVKVATTKAQRKLFFKLRRHKARLERLGRDEAEYIASVLEVSAEDVATMDCRLHNTDASIGGSDDDGLMDAGISGADSFFDHDANPQTACEAREEAIQRAQQLERALGTLDVRSRDIIGRRWLQDDKATLDELGEFYGISKERVRQIEETAFARLRRSLRGDGAITSHQSTEQRRRSTAVTELPVPAAEHEHAEPALRTGNLKQLPIGWQSDGLNSRIRRVRRPGHRPARRGKRIQRDVPSHRPHEHLLQAL